MAAVRRDQARAILPTHSQIQRTVIRLEDDVETLSQGWDRALKLAGLQARRTPGRKGRKGSNRTQIGVVPAHEAIHHYFEAGNTLKLWPSETRIVAFADLADFRLGGRNDRPWREIVEMARQHRTRLGLPCPTEMTPHGPSSLGPVIGTPGCVPGASPKRTGHAGRPYTDAEIWAAIERYDREAPPGPRTQTGFKAFAAKHGLPSQGPLVRIGGFTRAMAAVRAKRAAPSGSAEDG